MKLTPIQKVFLARDEMNNEQFNDWLKDNKRELFEQEARAPRIKVRFHMADKVLINGFWYIKYADLFGKK